MADIDLDGIVLDPPMGEVTAGLRLFARIRAQRRGRKSDVRQLRGQLLAAGFRDVIGDAFLQVAGTLEQTRETATSFATLLSAPDDIALAVEQGWTDPPELDRIVAAWDAWGERPDAFFYQPTIAAIGWKAIPPPGQRTQEPFEA